VPALKAPLDLTPKTAQVKLAVPKGADLKGATVTVAVSYTHLDVYKRQG